MLFEKKYNYGRELFYPIGEESLRFIKAFPGSSGARKSLTVYQKELLEELGIVCKIIKGKEVEHDSRTHKGLQRIPESKVQSQAAPKHLKKAREINKRKKLAC